MKKILLFLNVFSSLSLFAQTTVDLEITSPQANMIDIYLIPSAMVGISEITFTIKRPTSCGVSLSSPTSAVSRINFGPNGTANLSPDDFASFNASSVFPYPTISARTKVMSLTLTGGTGTCPIRVEDLAALLPQGTFNIADNLGVTVSRNIFNNATNVVLPVEFLSFKATKSQGKTVVEWESVQEKNLSNYIIERSEDGKNFMSLGFERPKAKSDLEKAAYSFVDEQPEIGINYYRLQSKGVRKEDFKYSKVVSVDFGLGIKAKAFPNPFAAELSIEIDIEQGIKGEVTIDMFDTAGKQVLSKKINAEGRKLIFEVPTEGLVPGSYVIRVKNGSTTWQHKITKQ
jgi:Secretion system C-terminal sorting domain